MHICPHCKREYQKSLRSFSFRKWPPNYLCPWCREDIDAIVVPQISKEVEGRVRIGKHRIRVNKDCKKTSKIKRKK